MGLMGDMLLNFAVFIDESDRSVCESDGEKVAAASCKGDPFVIDCIGVEIHPFGGCSGVGVPLEDGVVIGDATLLEVYLVS